MLLNLAIGPQIIPSAIGITIVNRLNTGRRAVRSPALSCFLQPEAPHCYKSAGRQANRSPPQRAGGGGRHLRSVQAGLGSAQHGGLRGVGHRSADDCSPRGDGDPCTLRQKFSVVVEKTARELAGAPCRELEEAVATYAGRAA